MYFVVKCSFLVLDQVFLPLTLHLCYYLGFSEVCTSERNSRIILKTEDRCQIVNSSFGNYSISNPPVLLQLIFFSFFLSFFLLALQPNAGYGLLIPEVFLDHTQPTQHSRQDSSGRVISSSQKPLPDNTQQTQEIDTHVLGGIRTHNLSRRSAADVRFRPRGYWDRRIFFIIHVNIQ